MTESLRDFITGAAPPVTAFELRSSSAATPAELMAGTLPINSSAASSRVMVTASVSARERRR